MEGQNGNMSERHGIMNAHTSSISKKDFHALLDFIDREDIEKNQEILVLSRDDNFKEAEVIVLFKDELFVRCRRKEETVLHNENLGMDCDFRFNWDSAISMSKKDISCISVLRPPICNCSSCSQKRERGEEPEQAKYYVLEIMTPAKDYSVRIPKSDKSGAFALQDYIRQWRFESGAFAKGAKRKKIKKQ